MGLLHQVSRELTEGFILWLFLHLQMPQAMCHTMSRCLGILDLASVNLWYLLVKMHCARFLHLLRWSSCSHSYFFSQSSWTSCIVAKVVWIKLWTQHRGPSFILTFSMSFLQWCNQPLSHSLTLLCFICPHYSQRNNYDAVWAQAVAHQINSIIFSACWINEENELYS